MTINGLIQDIYQTICNFHYSTKKENYHYKKKKFLVIGFSQVISLCLIYSFSLLEIFRIKHSLMNNVYFRKKIM